MGRKLWWEGAWIDISGGGGDGWAVSDTLEVDAAVPESVDPTETLDLDTLTTADSVATLLT